jgi:dCTP deaminase
LANFIEEGQIVSVLSSSEIRKRLRMKIDESQSLVITPLLDEDFDYDAVDIRLGCYFRLPAISRIKCIEPYRESGVGHYPELIHKPYRRIEETADKKDFSENKPSEEEGTLILQPQHAVLASTLEYIKLPADVSGEILTKSSWARYFISIASAPWIHPLYRGCLTLEITNLGNVPVALPVGEPIAQLVFIKLEGQCQMKDIIKGSYAGAILPEAPTFRR